MLRYLILIIFNIVWNIAGGTDLRINFIKSFVVNEMKPTILVYNLCWGKGTELTLAKQMASIGIRTTMSVEPTEHLDHSLLFVIDLNCTYAGEVLARAVTKHLLRSPYRWLIFSQSSSETLLEELPFLPDSDLVLARPIGDGFEVKELHKPSPTAAYISTLRGFYSNGSFTDVRLHRTLFRRRRDLMGSPLTMSNVIQDSNSTQYHLPREDRLELQYDAISKISWSNVKLGFLMLNATPRYIFSHRWGYQVNGKFSGMIDDLMSKRADVGSTCLMKTDRIPVVTFTDNLASFRVRFVFRQPPLPYVSNIFSLPFSSGVWLALFVCSVAATVSIFLASRWEAGIEKNSTYLDGSIGDALLLTMSAVSQQGCVMEPKKASGRIMLWILFAALMALYAAYSANIVVLLQAPSNAIRTLAQLTHSKITMAADDVDYNYFTFKMNKDVDSLRNEIFKKVEPEKGKRQFYELKEGVQRIRQGLFALHAIVQPVYRQIEATFLEHEKCDLVEVDFLNDIDPFTPVQKHSPYLELLRVVFKQLQESGIRAVWISRLLTPKPKCAHKGAAFSSVGLLDLEPVLLLMLYGFALSTAIFVMEIIVFKITHRRRQHEIPTMVVA